MSLFEQDELRGFASARISELELDLARATEERNNTLKAYLDECSVSKQLVSRIAELEAENARYREALEKIAKPSSCVTDGSGSAEEYEELYDFWHMSSSEKLSIAREALKGDA